MTDSMLIIDTKKPININYDDYFVVKHTSIKIKCTYTHDDDIIFEDDDIEFANHVENCINNTLIKLPIIYMLRNIQNKTFYFAIKNVNVVYDYQDDCIIINNNEYDNVIKAILSKIPNDSYCEKNNMNKISLCNNLNVPNIFIDNQIECINTWKGRDDINTIKKLIDDNNISVHLVISFGILLIHGIKLNLQKYIKQIHFE